MIIEYEKDTGKIFHIMNDPVPEGIPEMFEKLEKVYMNVPPVDNVSVKCEILENYVKDGKICKRPKAGTSFELNGRIVRLTNVPDDSEIEIFLNPQAGGQGFKTHMTAFEIDEPGTITVAVTPPWPYMTEVHNVEVE